MKVYFFLSLLTSTILFSCNSQSKSSKVSDDIVIVNASVSSRVRLAKDIAYLNSLHPKVVAIDFQFSEQRQEYGDSLLIATLSQCKDLIMAVTIKDYPNESKKYFELDGTLPEFRSNAKSGFVNLLFEDDKFQTLKKFSLYEIVDGEVIYPFGIRVAMDFDSLKTISFLKDKPKIMNVDYKGNEEVFRTVSYFDLVNRKITVEEIKDKIVLIGFIGLYEGYQGQYDEDKFFSPMNSMRKPYKPDMYGVVYHANIIAQVLAGDLKD